MSVCGDLEDQGEQAAVMHCNQSSEGSPSVLKTAYPAKSKRPITKMGRTITSASKRHNGGTMAKPGGKGGSRRFFHVVRLKGSVTRALKTS